MLVLSRKLQQQILMPDLNIRITVLSVGTNRVQIGIEAPRGIQVVRPELPRTKSEDLTESSVFELFTMKSAGSGRA